MTGGAGFIGSNLVHLLLRRGHTVTVLDNLSSGYRDNLRVEARFINGDCLRYFNVYGPNPGAAEHRHGNPLVVVPPGPRQTSKTTTTLWLLPI